MYMIFVTTFVEMMRLLDAEFDMVVDCIANGTIPELDGVAEVRNHLEVCATDKSKHIRESKTIGSRTFYQTPNVQQSCAVSVARLLVQGGAVLHGQICVPSRVLQVVPSRRPSRR